MQNYFSVKMVVFDLDGTLTPSKNSPDAEMSHLISSLLQKKLVAVISGGSYEQMKTQFLDSLIPTSSLENLFLLPSSGASFYQLQNNNWENLYSYALNQEEKQKIMSALAKALKASGYIEPYKKYGDIIEDRTTQITFSGLGQKAPLELKTVWDPERIIRNKIIEILKPELSNFEIRIGGTTSIDITHKNIDKAFGVSKLSEITHIPITNMLFVGDALQEGGNDAAVEKTGIASLQVSNIEDTKNIIRSMMEAN